MPTASPGWYPDPERLGGYRWWDGEKWSRERRVSSMTVLPEQLVASIRDARLHVAGVVLFLGGLLVALSAYWFSPLFYVGMVAGMLGILFQVFLVKKASRRLRRWRDGPIRRWWLESMFGMEFCRPTWVRRSLGMIRGKSNA